MISSFGPCGWMTFFHGHDLEVQLQEEVVRFFKGVIV